MSSAQLYFPHEQRTWLLAARQPISIKTGSRRPQTIREKSEPILRLTARVAISSPRQLRVNWNFWFAWICFCSLSSVIDITWRLTHVTFFPQTLDTYSKLLMTTSSKPAIQPRPPQPQGKDGLRYHLRTGTEWLLPISHLLDSCLFLLFISC